MFLAKRNVDTSPGSGPLPTDRFISHTSPFPMANPIKCSLCGKPATVHLTQIINNKVHKVDLCEACA